MKTHFDITKAAQTAHYFISRAGGELEILKLVKLIYLSDRHSLKMRRIPVVGGSYFSLKHGPVTSEVLDLINDGTPDENSPWEQLILDREHHRVATTKNLVEYDALSASELKLLAEVWQQFGAKGKWDLVEWTHRHCEEWSDPRGGRTEISARRMAESFAWTPAEVEDFETEMGAQNRLQEILN